MDTLSFLRAVWPSVGPYLLAIPVEWVDKDTQEQRSGFRHFVHHDATTAANHAMQLACDRNAPTNVFFALGSIVEERAKRVRVADNIAAMRAFWLDIDVKPSPTAYATQREAFTALKGFCAAMGMPKPMVVTSGGGLHVYWLLTDDVPADQWLHYATILKSVAKRWGLRADPSRTADRASVLRPAGTFNWKTGTPREVCVVVEAEPTPTKAFLTKLATLAESEGVVPVARPARVEVAAEVLNLMGAAPAAAIADAGINAAAATGVGAGYTQPNAKQVVTRCQQLKWQATHPTEVDEPQWYDMVGCLRHAERGEEAVHVMSSGHPTYTEERTNNKIDQHVAGGYGPTLCATFEDHRPGGCAGCPHAGKVKSPIVLGRSLQQVEAPKVTIDNASGETLVISLPDAPAPFMRVVSPTTGAARIAMRIDDEDGAFDEVIYEFDLYPCKLVYDERESKFHASIRRWLPMDGWEDFSVPLGMFYDKRTLASTLGNLGVMPDTGKIDKVVQYMVAYIRTLQKHAASTVVYAQLGWRGTDKIVLPNCIVTADAVIPIEPSANVASATMCLQYPPRGDLSVWKEIVAAYEAPRMEGFQFGFCVGFGAPLFNLLGVAGTTVSLVGPPGAGKSTALFACNSIVGHPSHFGRIDLANDTHNAVYGKLGVLNHFCVTWDETSNLAPDILSDFLYNITRGQGKQRLNRDGTVADNHGNWATPAMTTTNKSMLSKLATYKDDASAESVRVFEYNLPGNTMTKAQADSNFDRLKSNYGVAAPIYCQYLVRNRVHVIERIGYWRDHIDAVANVTSGERFWSAGPACILAGAEAATACGLVNVDMARMVAFVVGEIARMRGAVTENVRGPVSSISEYLSRHLDSMLVINSETAAGALIGREPRRELRIRVEQHTRRMYIDRANFRRFCVESSVDVQALEHELLESGVLIDKARRIVLGKGTVYGLAQTWAWVIDLNHPLLGNVVVQAVPATPTVPAVG